VNRVDPPDYPAWPTGRRLLRLWWGERRLGALGLTCAFCYTALSLAIPVLIQRAIDNSIVHHKQAIWPYVVAIVGVAAIRFGINFTRRYATARIGIRIEARMRELLYQAYLRFPRAFYDRHPTGQVLSRATNDLYPIRYFIGWGLVQGVQSVMMIFGAAVILLLVSPRLALYTAVSMPLVGIVACCSRTRCTRSRVRYRSERATSPRLRTSPSSGSRWCRLRRRGTPARINQNQCRGRSVLLPTETTPGGGRLGAQNHAYLR